MQPNDPLIYSPALEEAIDRNPLIVTPDTLLLDAIALMSQARGSRCSLTESNTPVEPIPSYEGHSSCVLVMEGNQLLGIFTERDIVWLTAEGRPFEEIKISEVMTQPVLTMPESNFQDVFAAIFVFRRNRVRHLVIVDAQNQLIGMVSQESIRRILRPANLLKLRRVSEVMATQMIHAPATTSVLNLARLMAEQRVSCVVITQENGYGGFYPLGIVTERDIVQFQALRLNLAQTLAQTVMSTPLFLLHPQDSLWKAHQEMQRRRVRRLVVSWDLGRGLGIITQTNLMRVFDPVEMYGVIEVLQRTIEQLEAEKAELLQSHKAALEQHLPYRPAQLNQQAD